MIRLQEKSAGIAQYFGAQLKNARERGLQSFQGSKSLSAQRAFTRGLSRRLRNDAAELAVRSLFLLRYVHQVLSIPVHNYIISAWLGPAMAMELFALLSYLYSVHSWTQKTQVFFFLIAKFKSEFQDYTQGHDAHKPKAARGHYGSQINGEISVQTG
jgi:hypothetical protein